MSLRLGLGLCLGLRLRLCLRLSVSLLLSVLCLCLRLGLCLRLCSSGSCGSLSQCSAASRASLGCPGCWVGSSHCVGCVGAVEGASVRRCEVVGGSGAQQTLPEHVSSHGSGPRSLAARVCLRDAGRKEGSEGREGVVGQADGKTGHGRDLSHAPAVLACSATR